MLFTIALTRLDGELDSFFAYYADRYMASDVEAISAVYEAPLLAVRDGKAIHLPDRAAVRAHLADLMDATGPRAPRVRTSRSSTFVAWGDRA